jgi:hypothetical protein
MPPTKRRKGRVAAGRAKSAAARRATAAKKTKGAKRGRKPTFTDPQVDKIRRLAREEIEAALRQMFAATGVRRRSG